MGMMKGVGGWLVTAGFVGLRSTTTLYLQARCRLILRSKATKLNDQ